MHRGGRLTTLTATDARSDIGKLWAALPDAREHRGPFDRVIAATALMAGLALVSADVAFGLYGVKRIWA